MPLNQFAAEEEAQPCASDAVRCGIAGTRETGKEASLLLVRDADAAVVDAHQRALLILCLRHRNVDQPALLAYI